MPEICSTVAAPIRTLLSNIKLASERLSVLTEEYGDEKIRRFNSVLEHSYHQLRRLLINISIVGTGDKGEIPWLAVPTEIRELCAGITGATAFFAKKSGISVIFESKLESCYAVVDRDLIEQMLLNLLSNSHLESGGRVTVTLTQSGNRLIISVNDNGAGIPPEMLPTVFCRWKASKTLTETASGAGLGLGAACRIAEKHGGAIILESKKGQGTSVRVMLPTDNEPSAIFRSSRTPYNLDNMDPLLIHLSTWLPTSEYLQMLND
jgi:signal transduction histidine kinase